MGKQTCCVVTCKNTGRNSKIMFFRFPHATSKRGDQRNEWIAAVQSRTANGPAWQPKSDDRICSAHFVGGDRSLDKSNPSYAPIIFPDVCLSIKGNKSLKLNKVKRLNKTSMISTGQILFLSTAKVVSQAQNSGKPSQITVILTSEAEGDESLPSNGCEDTSAIRDCLDEVRTEYILPDVDRSVLLMNSSDGEENFVDHGCQSESVETMEYVDSEIDLLNASFMLIDESQINSVAQVCQEEAVVERVEIECGMQYEFHLNSDCGNVDTVLADKGFPGSKTIVDDSGKNILVVMPPLSEDKTEFTMQETEDTYIIASVRIHVERIMQRLRIHKILDKIPTHLFKHVDDIVHMYCVLVNLQPSTFATSVAEEGA
ncbi:hypothetical protein QAD02_008658 [Eretmocerus hayati]|uniref:Uncharacterized protein n=1 Tax=Eretmocerus hayati TaxID=131215 RepID=A0ACC2N7E2_9HYME|nr:hypothetical protein QAD02_008658 [Eretmocerus hayati]